MATKISLVFAMFLCIISCQGKHNMEKVAKVYDLIQNDILMFKGYHIFKRGDTFIIRPEKGGNLAFKHSNGNSGYKYQLLRRDEFIQDSITFFMEFNFDSEHDFTVFYSRMIDKYESFGVFAIYGHRRDNFEESIMILVTSYDLLIYYPEDEPIPNGFYEWTLEGGAELSRLSSNWFYLKTKSPVRSH